MNDKKDVSRMNVGEINKPIAYCVDLEEDALIEASKILGLDATDVNFLDIPLYTHSMRELSDEEIMRIYLGIFKSLGLNYPALFHKFAREVLKKASEK